MGYFFYRSYFMFLKTLWLTTCLISVILCNHDCLAETQSTPAKTKLVNFLVNLPSFEAKFSQRTLTPKGAALSFSPGKFSFDATHKFRLDYDKKYIPLLFVFDGQWLAQVDTSLNQVSYIHKDDVPLSTIFDKPKDLLKKNVHIHSTNKKGITTFTCKWENTPDIVVLKTDIPKKQLLGWELHTQDGSITEVNLSNHTPLHKDSKSLFIMPTKS